jgi:two-component system nitrate/nitrite sensor histidine kinase NarX
MKRITLRGRFTILFSAFVLLVIVSGVTTFIGIQSQKEDALVINLAGRQRMLIQQMTRQSLEIERNSDRNTEINLMESIDAFEQTLWALKNGGTAPYLENTLIVLPSTISPQIRDQLDRVELRWLEYKQDLQVILADNPTDPAFQDSIRSLEEISPDLLRQTDAAVRMYAEAATQKTNNVKWIQIVFLASGLLLLGLGGIMVQKSIFIPLRQLDEEAELIGRGDFEKPINIQAPEEIEILADTLEKMRLKLKESQAALIAWAETLEERVVQRTRELEALHAVSRDISSRLNINEVLNSVTERARQLLDAEVAYLCLIDDRGQMLNLQSTSGPNEAVAKNKTLVRGELQGQILSGKRAVSCGISGCHGFCEIMAAPFQTSHLASPLNVGGRMIGALCIGSSQSDYFSGEAPEMLTMLANAAAVAIENARLYEKVERTAVLEERQRLAADMHDGLAQTLHYMLINMELTHELVDQGKTKQALNVLERCRQAMDQASLETRRAIASLQEDIPRHYTIQEHLTELIQEFPQRSNIEFISKIKLPLVLPLQELEQVLRVAREALLNAQKYSQANRITIDLTQSNGNLTMVVQDDGIGFDPQPPVSTNRSGHFGLNIMRARAARLGGNLDIRSSPGSGTRISLRWASNLKGK